MKSGPSTLPHIGRHLVKSEYLMNHQNYKSILSHIIETIYVNFYVCILENVALVKCEVLAQFI